MVKLTEDMIVARTRVSDLAGVKKLNCWGADIDDVSVLKKCNNVVEKVCEKIHKNKPQQHECQVCGGVEKDCKRVVEQQYHG